MSSRWVPVYQGTTPEVLVMQSNCEASGIPTFVPDLNLAYLDPTARGGNIFLMQLLVPEDRLAEARDLVPETRRSSIPAVEPEPGELARLGSRVRTCAMFIVSAPLAVLFGLQYFKELRAAADLPPGHHWTVRAFWFGVVVSVLVPVAFMLRALGTGVWWMQHPAVQR